MTSLIEKFTCLTAPIADILLRLAIAYPFFSSGRLKLDYFLNDQLDTLYFLFEDYNVPFLSVKLAAWMGTAGELVLPILIMFGLMTRIGALGLLVMTAIIYNVDQNAHAVYWAAICIYFIANGAGKLSLDRFFKIP